MSNLNPIQKKFVLFGAGKIGRSFIGQLFSKGGYEVVFIDISQSVIAELNLRRNYNVVIKGERSDEVINVQNVRGVFADDTESVIAEITTADIAAVSVGLYGLKSIMPVIAKGLISRFEHTETPLDIIIAENLRNSAEFIREELSTYLPNGYPLAERVGLIETSIGKMVPIMSKKDMEADILQVFAEPYNTLILDKNAFKNPIPQIEGLDPKKNIKAWVDRKLFIHNLGHAAAAYLGFLAHPEYTLLYEVLSDSQLKEKIRNTMLQAADLLLKKYPDEFTIELLTEHIDDLILRFQNKALGDTVFRVGCDLQRKLGADDRLTGAIHLAVELELPYDLILEALVSGCHFSATDESGNVLPTDSNFPTIYANGIKSVLTAICGFDEIADCEVFFKAISFDNSLNELNQKLLTSRA